MRLALALSCMLLMSVVNYVACNLVQINASTVEDVQRAVHQHLANASNVRLEVYVDRPVLDLDSPIELDTRDSPRRNATSLRPAALSVDAGIQLFFRSAAGGGLTFRCRRAATAFKIAWGPLMPFSLNAEGNTSLPLTIENCRDGAIHLYSNTSKNVTLAQEPCVGCPVPHIHGLHNLLFVNNSGGQGGALRVLGGAWALTRVHFRGNRADQGGGIFVDRGSIELVDCSFESNSCLGPLEDPNCPLGSNPKDYLTRGPLHMTGGAVHIAQGGCLVYALATFTGNEAAYGGAIFIEDMDGSCVDIPRRAQSSPSQLTNIEESIFVRNVAACDGGAVWAHQTRVNTRTRLVRILSMRSNFMANQAGGRGGAMWVMAEEGLSLNGSRFINNTSVLGGGAVYFTSPAPGFLQTVNSTYEGNWVEPSQKVFQVASDPSSYMRLGAGGAILVEARYRGGLHINQSQFIGNQAPFQGGAVASFGLDLVNMFGNAFLINRCAGSGGAVSIHSFYGINNIGDCAFEGNTAGEGDMLDHVGAILHLGSPTLQQFSEALVLHLGNASGGDTQHSARKNWLLGACGLGGGGAICLQNPGDVNTNNNMFKWNTASFGGGMYLEVSQCMDLYAASSPQAQQDACGIDLGHNNTLVGNHVQYVGPNVFLTRADPMGKLLGSCPAGGGGGGGCLHGVSTRARDMVVTVGRVQVPVETTLSVRAEEDFPLNTTVMEAQGQPVSVFDTNITLQVVSSTCAVRTLEAVVPAMTRVHWPITLKQVTVYGPPGRHLLTVRATREDTGSLVANGTFVIHIRECHLGEVLSFKSPSSAGKEILLCSPCGRNFFSFDPRRPMCDECPTNANCSRGGAVLAPHTNFWHSHPRSPLMHRCPLSGACVYQTRSSSRMEDLLDWQSNHWTLLDGQDPARVNSYVEEYRKMQCAEGYEGTLCGSCAQGWARTRHGCSHCQGVAVSWFLFVLARAVEFIWIGGVVWLRFKKRINTDQKQEKRKKEEEKKEEKEEEEGKEEEVLKEQEMGAESRQGLASTRWCSGSRAPVGEGEERQQTWSQARELSEVSWVGSQDGSNEEPQRVPVKVVPVASLTSDRAIGEVQLDMAAHAIVTDGSGNEVPETSPQTPTSWDLSGLPVVKSLIWRPAPGEVSLPVLAEVAIIYMQMLGTLSRLSVPWSDVITRTFSFINLSGTSLTWANVACLMAAQSPWKKAAMTALVSAATPVVIAFLVVLLFLGIRLHLDPNKEAATFRKEVITAVTAQALVFYYSNVSVILLSLFSCVRVDPPAPRTDMPYRSYLMANEPNGYWTQEYSTTCWGHSPHALLASVLGVPGIIIFSLGLPIGFFLFLHHHRSRLEVPSFKHIYGVLYDSFRPQTYYWQLVNMAQLLLLVLVAEVLREFGGYVQLVSYMAILTVFLAAQLAYYPMASLPLNGLAITSTYATLASAYLGLPMIDVSLRVLHSVVLGILMVVHILVVLLFILHVIYCVWDIFPTAMSYARQSAMTFAVPRMRIFGGEGGMRGATGDLVVVVGHQQGASGQQKDPSSSAHHGIPGGKQGEM